jgi:hypothetical protein
MGEIKKKLNIKKITPKNLFLLVLLMAVMAVIGVIAKLIGSHNAGSNVAQAQSCWTPSGGTACTGCDCSDSASGGSSASSAASGS